MKCDKGIQENGNWATFDQDFSWAARMLVFIPLVEPNLLYNTVMTKSEANPDECDGSRHQVAIYTNSTFTAGSIDPPQYRSIIEKFCEFSEN